MYWANLRQLNNLWNNLLGAHLTEDLRHTYRCVCWIRQKAEKACLKAVCQCVCVCVYPCVDSTSPVWWRHCPPTHRDADRPTDEELLTALDVSTHRTRPPQHCRAVLLLPAETLAATGQMSSCVAILQLHADACGFKGAANARSSHGAASQLWSRFHLVLEGVCF